MEASRRRSSGGARSVYRLIFTPVFEDTALRPHIVRGSDVVQKEMYTFTDAPPLADYVRKAWRRSVARMPSTAHSATCVASSSRVPRWIDTVLPGETLSGALAGVRRGCGKR